MTSLRRLLIAVCLLAFGAAGLTACGSSDSTGATGSAQDILRNAFGAGKPIKSGRLDAALNLNLQGLKGLSGPVSLKLTGPFQSTGAKQLPAFDLALGLNAGGTSFTAGAVSTGQKGFLKLQGQTFEVGAQLYDAFKKGFQQASKSGAKQSGPSLKSLGIDPQRWLKDARKAPDTTVNGTDVAHVVATIDVSKLLDDVNTLLGKAGTLGVAGAAAKGLPTRITPQQRAAIERSVRKASFDVYAGKDDGILRRLVVDLDFSVPQSARGSAGGLTGGTATLDLKIDDLNQAQTITAPKNARPLSDLTSQLQGLFGGAGGATGSAGSGSGAGSGGATGGSSSKYLTCLDAAGQDIAKVQKCAALLGR